MKQFAVSLLALALSSSYGLCGDSLDMKATHDTVARADFATYEVLDCYLAASSTGPSKATLEWGVTAIGGTANIRLRYGPSRVVLTNVVMLAEGASAGAGGLADITGLDPATKYYAQLQVDSGSGYVTVGEVVPFTTAVLMPAISIGRTISIDEPPVPGLRAGYLNGSSTITTPETNRSIKWLPELVQGIIAATNYSSGLNQTTYPPIWVNNRVWFFSGYMYFDGIHYYQFGKWIDDGGTLYIDGKEVLGNTAYNVFGKCRTKQSEGWHKVLFRFANGTGGAGISGSAANATYSKDKNGLMCGFGYAKTTENKDPANMNELEWPCNKEGEDLLFRWDPQISYDISISSIEVDEAQYNVTISNLNNRVCSGKIFYGESGDIDVITNSTLMSDFRVNAYGTTTIELIWEEDQPPNCVIVIPEVGASEVISLTASPLVAASVKSVGSDFAVITTATGFDMDISGDTPHIGLTAYFGPEDAGTSELGWEGTQPFGMVKAGTHDFTLQNLTAGSSYTLRINAIDESGNSAWSDPVSFSVPAPADVPKRGRIVIIR